MADCSTKKKPAGGGGMGAVVKLVVKTFLEPRHYRQLQRTLGAQWSDTHGLTAAVRLMEAHGVKIMPEDEKTLAELPEERMIDALVTRLPHQSREQFEHFFLQLSFIASTTTRVRAGLEGGAPEAIEEALDNAENVGVLPYLLKMAVSQASQEVKSYATAHDEWLEETDKKMGPLLTAQGEQMSSQKALTQARAALAMFQEDAKEKTRSVMMALTHGNDEALAAGSFKAWLDFTQSAKKEREIRHDYEDRINRVKDELHQLRQRRVALARSFLSRRAEVKDQELLALGFTAFKEEVVDNKAERAAKQRTMDLEGRLEEYSKEASQRAKKVLARWCANSDEGLLTMSFTGWVAYMAEAKELHEKEKQVEAVNKELQAFCDKQSTLTMSLLQNTTDINTADLITTVLTAWQQAVLERKNMEAVEAELVSSTDKLMTFVSKNKENAQVALAGELLTRTHTLLIFCLAQWKRDAKVERMRRYGKEKNMKRKQELIGVRGLFKNFASELETSLKEGTPRIEAVVRRPKGGPAAA